MAGEEHRRQHRPDLQRGAQSPPSDFRAKIKPSSPNLSLLPSLPSGVNGGAPDCMRRRIKPVGWARRGLAAPLVAQWAMQAINRCLGSLALGLNSRAAWCRSSYRAAGLTAVHCCGAGAAEPTHRVLLLAAEGRVGGAQDLPGGQGLDLRPVSARVCVQCICDPPPPNTHERASVEVGFRVVMREGQLRGMPSEWWRAPDGTLQGAALGFSYG